MPEHYTSIDGRTIVSEPRVSKGRRVHHSPVLKIEDTVLTTGKIWAEDR